MRTFRAMLSIAVATAGLAGVGGIGSPGGAHFFGVAHAQEHADCKTQMDAGTTHCVVRVTAAINNVGKCTVVSYDPVGGNLALSQTGNKNIVIVWKLRDETGATDKFEFCRSTGDGVFLKTPTQLKDKQVDKMRISKSKNDDTASGAESECGTRFKWKFANVEGSSWGTEYKYKIQFHHVGTQELCVDDPWIKNGGSSVIN
ncbi:MAG: hypothetical protein J0L91_00875 [Burkholderiales bacterium]|nr:hypothetical protein [Burkholderiales bacterium]